MQRSVVFRHTQTLVINVNDEIGLEPHACYSIKEYLDDLRTEEGRVLLATHGLVYVFSDGSTEILEQKLCRISVEDLDAELAGMVLCSAAAMVPQRSFCPALVA